MLYEVITKSISVPAPEELKIFSSGYLPSWGPSFTGMNNSTLLLGILGIAAFAFIQLNKHYRSVKLNENREPLWPTLVQISYNFV